MVQFIDSKPMEIKAEKHPGHTGITAVLDGIKIGGQWKSLKWFTESYLRQIGRHSLDHLQNIKARFPEKRWKPVFAKFGKQEPNPMVTPI